MSSAAPKTVLKALSLLNLVAANPDRTLSELSRLADIPAPTALRLLRALQEEALVEVDQDGRYRLGVHCLVLGSTYLEGFDLRREARLELEELADRFDETVHLGVPDGTEVIYVDKVETSQSVRMYSRIGARSPMHSTGIGKAILAYAGDDLFQAVVRAGLPRRTPNTITDRTARRAKRTRRRGYAIDDIETAGSAVAAAVPTPRVCRWRPCPCRAPRPGFEERIPELGEGGHRGGRVLSARLGYKRKGQRMSDESWRQRGGSPKTRPHSPGAGVRPPPSTKRAGRVPVWHEWSDGRFCIGREKSAGQASAREPCASPSTTAPSAR